MTAPPLTFVATPPFHVEQQLQLHQLLHSPHSVGVCVSVELLFCILQVLFSDAAALPGISQWQRRGRGLRHGLHGGVGVVEWFANSGQTSFSFCIRVNESFTRVSLANAHFFTKGPIAN